MMKTLLLSLLFAGGVALVAPQAHAGGYSQRSYSHDRYDDDYGSPYRSRYQSDCYERRTYYCPPPVRYYRSVRYCPPRRIVHYAPRVGLSFHFR